MWWISYLWRPAPAWGVGWLASIVLLALPHVARAQQFTFRQYGQLDGLANLSVTTLLQDRAGYVWVGTENGLYRHDAVEFERFGEADGLADTGIQSAIEDAAGRLWVGTEHDLYLFDGRRFVAVRPDGRALSVQAGSQLASTAAGQLLVIEHGQLQRLSTGGDHGAWEQHAYFTAEQLRSLPALTQLTSIYVEPGGRVWLGCGHGICADDAGDVTLWSPQRGVPVDLWHSWLRDRSGRLWARGLQHVLVLLPGASAFVARDIPHARLTAGVLKVPLIEDADGRIITRSELGLMRWENDHWQEFTAHNGITTPEISALLTSRDGTVWLGLQGHGLWRWLGYGLFESWNVDRALGSNPVWVVLRDGDGNLTLGTHAGCLQLDARTRQPRTCGFEGLSNGETQAMAKGRDGSLWIAVATGEIFRVAHGQRRAALMARVPQTRMLLVDSAQRLWICSNAGIYQIAAGSAHAVPMSVPATTGEIWDAAEDDQGAVWFAAQGGLLRWSQGQWTLVKLEDPAHAGFATVTPEGNGWLWAGGASHGVLHLHWQDGRADHATWISDPNVAAAAVYFTGLDARRRLWVGTDEGFALFDGQVWRKFSQPDGLIWNDTDQNAVFRDADGSVWIGTSGGLTHAIQPERLIASGPLDLRIAHATLGAAELDPAQDPKLQWRRGPALDLQLQDLDFGLSSKLQLQVHLRGLSDDWFQTRDFHVHYPGLSPGRYTFEAIAHDPDHQRQSRLVQLRFEILPPWWRSAWFNTMAVAIALLLLSGAWRWSMLRIEARRAAVERELRERQALLERATRDPLTKLWNRQAIMEMLAREMETARSGATPLAVALIDIDHFKRVNDTMGHLTGDEVLRQVSRQLSSKLRARDALGRYGGEELLLLLPEAAPQNPLQPVERLQRLIAEIPFSYNGSPFRVTASFGVAWLSAHADTSEDLLARADEALYRAKHAGRDRVVYAATGS